MENPIKMDDLGVPLFLETPLCFSFLGFIDHPITPNNLAETMDSVAKLPSLNLT